LHKNHLPVAAALEELRAVLRRGAVDVLCVLHLEDAFRLPRDAWEPGGVPDEIRCLLRSLSSLCKVAVVSDRDRGTLARALDFSGLVTVGSGGLEIAGPDGLYFEHADARVALPELAAVGEEVEATLGHLEPVTISRRKYAVELIHRNATVVERRAIRESIDSIVAAHDRLIVVKRGALRVIRPDVAWDCGMAVRWVLRALDDARDSVLPIYVGRRAESIRAVRNTGIGIAIGRLTGGVKPRFRFNRFGDTRRFLLSLGSMLEEADREGRETG